jgi:hypothetical protein
VDRVRVEAASVGGKPVYFVVEFPWEADATSAFPGLLGETWPVVALIFLFGLPLAATGLAVWNWRAGRADLGGAARLAGVLFALWLARWAFTAHHVTDQREEQLLLPALGLAVYQAAIVAVFYLALEPVVRKRWPWRMVGWARLVAGRVRDPLVGRDVLVGLAIGSGFVVVLFNFAAGPVWAPELIGPFPLGDYDYDPAVSVTHPLTTGVRMGFTYFFLIFLAHWACRNRWLGGAIVFLALLALYFSAPDVIKPVTLAVTVAVGAVVLQVTALRFGLLAFVASLLPWGWLLLSGWSLDVRAWYATGPNLAIGVMLALTGYCAYTATGGRGVTRAGG